MVFAPSTWPRRLLARRWLLAFVPINAATAGFGVVLPLLILLPLHGTWSQVALAATLFNSAIIASSVVWGHLSDQIHQRRLFLVVSYGGFAALYLVLIAFPSLPALYVIYTIIGLLAPAGASASTLLLLEKFDPAERPDGYASFQEMSILGSMAGLLLGFFWTLDAYSLYPILYLLSALAAASALSIWFGVSEGERTFTTAHVARHPESLVSRLHWSSALRLVVPFFPVRPNAAPHPWRRLRRWAREELRHELPLVLTALFLFNFSSNLFNISLTPYFTSIGIGVASIFLINFANSSAQGFLFPFSGALTRRIGPDRLVRTSTYIRSLGYLATAGFALVVMAAPSAFAANFVAYGVIGGAVAFFTVASTMMLFRGLRGPDAGRLLGVNSALGGAAAVAGAGASGLIALFGSFDLVFLISAGGLLASLPLWTAASVAYERRRRDAEGGATGNGAAPEGARASKTG